MLWTTCKCRLVFNSLAGAKMGRDNSGMVTNDLIDLRLLQINDPLKAKYEVVRSRNLRMKHLWRRIWSAIQPEWPSYISRHFEVTPVASAFHCASISRKVIKKRFQQSISMVTMTIMHGYVNTARTLQHHMTIYPEQSSCIS